MIARVPKDAASLAGSTLTDSARFVPSGELRDARQRRLAHQMSRWDVEAQSRCVETSKRSVKAERRFHARICYGECNGMQCVNAGTHSG